MKISVIIPTMRPLGLFEFQLPALANQEMPKRDWELVLIDDYPDSREKKVGEFADEHGMNVKWMRSKPSYWRTNAPIGCARNTGLIHAEGKLCVFFDDFSWVKPKYLETMWRIYDSVKGHSLIGPVTAIEYPKTPYPKDMSTLEIRHEDDRIPVEKMVATGLPGGYATDWRGDWREHRDLATPAPAGWFYTCNASAPLDKIIEVNGFWEIADLTREEDVLMGLALERVGWKFCFLNSPDATVYHACHDRPEHALQIKRYKKISYEQLGWEEGTIKNGHSVLGMIGPGKCGLNTASDEVQLVTKDVFKTEHPGSWALIEHFIKNPNLKFNAEIGFDLREEREKRGVWVP